MVVTVSSVILTSANVAVVLMVLIVETGLSRLSFHGNGGIYETRGTSRVDLRRNHGTSPTGIYCCNIPTIAVHDDTDLSVRDTVYVGLYTASGGKYFCYVRTSITGGSEH